MLQRLAAYLGSANSANASLGWSVPLLVSHRPHREPHPFQPRPYKVAAFLPYEAQVS